MFGRSLPVVALLMCFFLLLSGCLEDLKRPRKGPRPSPTPIEAGKCEPSEAFDLSVAATDLYALPPGILTSSKKKGFAHGIGQSLKFLSWYTKWLMHAKTSPFGLGKTLALRIGDTRLGEAQFTSSVLSVEALVFDVEHVRWERVLLGLGGLKGSQMDPSALKVETLDSYDFDFPVPVSTSSLMTSFDDEDLDSKGNAKKNLGITWVHSAERVRLTLDLKKFSFGAHATSDEPIRKAAGQDKALLVRLKHLNGWFRILDGSLHLAGMTAGNCPEPPPVTDTTPPTIQVDSITASGLTTSRLQTIRFSASEPVAFTCNFDQADWEACSLSSDNALGEWAATDLADGDHQLSIRAQDAAGNSSAVLSVHWTVDSTPPTLTLVSAAPADPVTASTSFELNFAVSESAQASCALDGSIATACSSPIALTDLTDGDHRLEIRAVDLAGLESDPLVYEWNIQSVPPSVQLIAVDPSTSPVASNAISFTFQGATGTKKYLCGLDQASLTVCTSPLTFEGLGDGAHRFEVRAVDALGRQGEPATYSWTVDTLAPEVFVVSSSITSSPTSQNSIDLSFGASETARFDCALDDQSAAPCESPIHYDTLSEGQHRILLSAIDPAGNSSGSPLEYAWVIDQTAPLTVITSADPSGSLINRDTLRLSLQANEEARFECRLDDASFLGCAAESEFTGLADGAHKIEVRAIDRALNIGPSVAHEFTVDTQAPGVSITSVLPAAKITSAITRDISFEASEVGSTFECALDDATFTECTSPASFKGLSEGAHTFTVRATDAAGNVSGEPAKETWTVDLTPPETLLVDTDPSDAVTNSTSIIFTFESNEADARFECQRDDLAFEACASPYVINNLADGPHTFSVRAIDAAGNLDASASTYAWAIDTTPLQITNLKVINLTQTSATVTWTTNRPATSSVTYTDVVAARTLTTTPTTTLVTSHSVQLTGLTRYTLYSIVAHSATATGQGADSVSLSFRTSR